MPVVSAPCVLNVSGNSKRIELPAYYAGWDHLLLDIAPGPDVDLLLDARKLATIDADQFDAIYCPHNLERYYRHDCVQVLGGFLHVLKPHGYVEIRVPDMAAVLAEMVSKQLDIDDVIYGWGAEIERSGADFYAHKRGFTEKSLRAALERAGFAHILTGASTIGFELRAVAFKTEPNEAQRATFGI